MTKRIAIKLKLANQAGLHYWAEKAYVPRENSRFAVAKKRADDKNWTIYHRSSGLGVSSLLPSRIRNPSLSDLLLLIEVWETSGLDFSAFDALGFNQYFEGKHPRETAMAMHAVAVGIL